MYAIKGTDEDMQCRDFQYAISKTYKMDDNPILCKQGFHACLNPYEVEKYYKNNGRNRYFLVDLGGTITDCDTHDTKVAANEITFLKEVSVDDFPALFEEFRKDKERLDKLDYDEGFARVRKEGKWNFIDKDGNYLSKDWFDWVFSFSEGFAQVRKEGKWNYLDHDGKILCKEWFDNLDIFSDGFAQVRKNGKWRFIDKEGNYLSKEWFDYVGDFIEGFALVVKNDKWYRLYTDGRLVLANKFHSNLISVHVSR